MSETTPPVSDAAPWSGSGFLRDLFGRDPGAAFGRLDEQVEWIVPGDPVFGGGAHRGKEAVSRFFALVLELFPMGLAIEQMREWPGAAGSVVEVVLSGATAEGHEYRNAYAFVIETHAGRVSRVREYADTSYAEAVLRRGA